MSKIPSCRWNLSKKFAFLKKKKSKMHIRKLQARRSASCSHRFSRCDITGHLPLFFRKPQLEAHYNDPLLMAGWSSLKKSSSNLVFHLSLIDVISHEAGTVHKYMLSCGPRWRAPSGLAVTHPSLVTFQKKNDKTSAVSLLLFQLPN